MWKGVLGNIETNLNEVPIVFQHNRVPFMTSQRVGTYLRGGHKYLVKFLDALVDRNPSLLGPVPSNFTENPPRCGFFNISLLFTETA